MAFVREKAYARYIWPFSKHMFSQKRQALHGSIFFSFIHTVEVLITNTRNVALILIMNQLSSVDNFGSHSR